MKMDMESTVANDSSENGRIKIYKFRPLGNEIDYYRLKEILTTGKFWCSKFSELNDPMEGTFTSDDASIIDTIFSKKNNYRICSFSGEKALLVPSMWGYYANGFKGVAIEIEIFPTEVKQITYGKNILHPKGKDYITVEKILTKKLSSWKHECEYRFLEKTNASENKIGKIAAIYFGNPYGNARNRNYIANSSASIKSYNRFKEKIFETIRTLNDLKAYSVKIKDSMVIPKLIQKTL